MCGLFLLWTHSYLIHLWSDCVSKVQWHLKCLVLLPHINKALLDLQWCQTKRETAHFPSSPINPNSPFIKANNFSRLAVYSNLHYYLFWPKIQRLPFISTLPCIADTRVCSFLLYCSLTSCKVSEWVVSLKLNEQSDKQTDKQTNKSEFTGPNYSPLPI